MAHGLPATPEKLLMTLKQVWEDEYRGIGVLPGTRL
jgi:hypothetical protein